MIATLRANLLASALGLLCAILLVIAVVQTVRIDGFGIWPLKINGMKAKYETAIDKLAEARAELHRISTAKNEQQAETAKNTAKAKDRIVIVERDAKRVEAAPLPGQCRSPKEILEADL